MLVGEGWEFEDWFLDGNLGGVTVVFDIFSFETPTFSGLTTTYPGYSTTFPGSVSIFSNSSTELPLFLDWRGDYSWLV